MRRIVLLPLVLVGALALPGTAQTQTEEPQMQWLAGGFHTHTGYSDGTSGKVPSDVWARAESKGLDFFSVTEHSEALPLPVTLSESCLPSDGGTVVECAMADSPERALAKWEATGRQAALASSTDFSAVRGFEFTSDVHGHINVIGSRNYTTRLEGGEITIEAFYDWLRRPAALGGGADGVAIFNHPDSKKLHDADPRKNWNDFEYKPDLDRQFVGVEVFNTRRDYGSNWYAHALNKGWHLGAIGTEDIHGTDWAEAHYARTHVLASSNTPAAIKDALLARRTYATLEPHDNELTFTVAGRGMGSRLYGVTGPVPVTFGASDGNAELVTSPNVEVSGGNVTVTGGEGWVFMRVTDNSGNAIAFSSPIWLSDGAAPAQADFVPHWVPGDLHVHTTWSHDTYGGPDDHNTGIDEFYTLGWTPGEQITNAEVRGLGFLALTDHNNTYSVYDPGRSSATMDLIPAYENSLAGHAQMIGTTHCVGVPGIDDCSNIADKNNPEVIRGLVEQLRSDGGVFQINHPSDTSWLSRFGDGAGLPGGGEAIVPDTVEVWNIGPWIYQHPFPASNDNDFSLRFWETYLDAGHRVAATGGSDNHWRSVSAAAGVGQPTTWVWVTEPGYQGIVEGMRAGRTTISSQPPTLGGSPFTLELDNGTATARIGDEISPASPAATLRVNGALTQPGAVVRFISDATGPDGVEFVAAPDGSISVPFSAVGGAKWVRAELRVPDLVMERRGLCDPAMDILAATIPFFEDPGEGNPTQCKNRLYVAALTSPIYLQ